MGYSLPSPSPPLALPNASHLSTSGCRHATPRLPDLARAPPHGFAHGRVVHDQAGTASNLTRVRSCRMMTYRKQGKKQKAKVGSSGFARVPILQISETTQSFQSISRATPNTHTAAINHLNHINHITFCPVLRCPAVKIRAINK